LTKHFKCIFDLQILKIFVKYKYLIPLTW